MPRSAVLRRLELSILTIFSLCQEKHKNSNANSEMLLIFDISSEQFDIEIQGIFNNWKISSVMQ